MSVEEGGREGGGADTELKTKTPHVNVGNKIQFVQTDSGDKGATLFGHTPLAITVMS